MNHEIRELSNKYIKSKSFDNAPLSPWGVRRSPERLDCLASCCDVGNRRHLVQLAELCRQDLFGWSNVCRRSIFVFGFVLWRLVRPSKEAVGEVWIILAVVTWDLFHDCYRRLVLAQYCVARRWRTHELSVYFGVSASIECHVALLEGRVVACISQIADTGAWCPVVCLSHGIDVNCATPYAATTNSFSLT